MSFSFFQVCCPSLLLRNPSGSSPLPLSEAKEQYSSQSLSNIPTLYGATWKMIASTSNMWQDRKRAINTVYAPVEPNAAEFSSEATWLDESSTKQSYTKGINYPRATETGYMHDWRGTGWLRLITTRWEIVGLGMVPHRNTAKNAESENLFNETTSVVLVTFVQKTLFSPQALSVMVRDAQLDGAQQEDILKHVSMALKGLGFESLSAEVEKLKAVLSK